MKRLSIRAKAGYGSAELGIAAAEFFVQVYLLKFYTDYVGLSPKLAGIALALAVVWDAISDPLMGEISDRTHGRFGRRMPYIAVGAVLLAATLWLLFQPPTLGATSMKFTFLLVGYILFNTGMTVLSVPHLALGGELSKDDKERTEIFGWRFFFTNLGLIFSILVPGIIARGIEGDIPPATAAMPWLVGAILVSSATTLFSTARFDRHKKPLAPTKFWHSIKAVLTNKPFIPLLLAYIVGSMGRTVNASIALFYYEYRLQIPESDVFLYVLLPFTFVIALSIVGWTLLARRVGKKMPAFWGIFLLGLGGCFAYPLFPVGGLIGPIFAGIIGGVLVGSIFLLDATVTDIVDHDELESGVYREGLYFGFWKMGAKLSRALGLAISGFVLEWIGFDGSLETQTEATSWGLALLFGPGVGVFFMLAAIIYLWMPLTKEKVAELQRRRAERDAQK